MTFAELQCTGEGLIAVDASHLFAGFLLVDQESSNGLRLLLDLDVDVESLATSLRNSGFISVPSTWPPAPATAQSTANVTIAPEARALFATASTIAQGFGHERIGTEHLLLAFLSTPSSYGYRVLTGFGVVFDTVKAKLGEWLVSGKYASEQAVPSPGAPTAGPVPGQLGIVTQIYGWTGVGYTVFIFLPCVATWFLRPSSAPILFEYLDGIGRDIFFYVIAYVLSSYSISYLLRSRAQLQLFGMPPSKAMVGLGVPFTCSLIVGVILALSIIPMISVFDRIAGAGIPVFILCTVVTLNLVIRAVAHWLLTFNIRGKPMNFFGRR